MTAQQRFDSEMERRDFGLLKPDTIAQVRRLCAHPGTARDMFYERVMRGCRALDERETDYRWQLFELVVNAWIICQDALEEERHRIEAAETWLIRNDPERQAMRRRLKALNYR